MTDPTGRLADLARHVIAEIDAFYSDLEPLNRRHASFLKIEAQNVERALGGYTEMPDAKRERLDAKATT